MRKIGILFYGFMCLILCGSAQTQPPPPQTSVSEQHEPVMTQVRKCITFVQLFCKDGGQLLDVKGTGFFVGYPDARIDGSFGYLVTNRHVAECWNEQGRPMQVLRISVRLNKRLANNEVSAQDVTLNPVGNVPWIFPSDDSVDLAVLPLFPDQETFDFKAIPPSIFVDKKLLAERKITEGEQVFFSGFFYQFPGARRMEPIVRQGIIAMMPEDKVPFVGRSERVYLADMHVFGGNSGSPAFINLGGFHGGSLSVGEDFRLLGIVNGEVSEDQNFNLELVTTLKGTARANSGISTIIPADELRDLLEIPTLVAMRNAVAMSRGTGKK